MDLPPPTDDALAQPTRARLFAMLRDLRGPASTEELAERLALHPNGVRLHLARLRDAGLVVRERSPQAPGRPRDMWLIAPDARPTGEPPTGYANPRPLVGASHLPKPAHTAHRGGDRATDRPRPRARNRR